MNINEQVQKAKEKLQEATDNYNSLLEKQETFNNLPERYKLAELIHEKMCHAHDISKCGFEYENWTTYVGSRRTLYVKKAENILAIPGINYSMAVEFISKL